MRIYTVVLSKPGPVVATATIIYGDASWPDEILWKGDRREFRLADGNPVELRATMDRLREVVAHQAAQAGAAFTIKDDGGDAPMRLDNVLGE